MSPSIFTLRATCAGLLVGLLGACSSMAPDYQRPAAPVPARFGEAGEAGGKAAADLAWSEYFTDPLLQALIRGALANNRDLRVALLSVRQYQAQFDVKEADRWPGISAGLGVTRQTSVSAPLSTVYNAGFLMTSYELDLFGRLRSLSDAAQAQYLASEQAARAAQISLIGAVANAYYSLRADQQQLRLATETVKTRESSLQLIRLRFDQGATNQLDLSQAESLLQSARLSLVQTARQTEQDQNALALLIGQALTPAQKVQLSAEDAPRLSAPAQPLGSELLLRRPDVLQAEQQLIAANANIGAARANFFPKISLSASAGSASTELSSLFQDGTFAWAVAPQLLLPVFDAGRNRANLRVAEVGRDIAVAQYEKAIQSAFREVADALALGSGLSEQLKTQQAQTAAAREVARLTDLRFAHGAASALEVQDAQRTLFAAQQAEIQLQSQLQQSYATLYRVLGGGWSPSTSAALRNASTEAGTPQ